MSDTYAFRTSRSEIADSIGGAFTGAPLTRGEMIEAGRASSAPEEVLLALASLPEDKRFASIRDLWPDLPDLPVEA
jgi:hypothetical protein